MCFPAVALLEAQYNSRVEATTCSFFTVCGLPVVLYLDALGHVQHPTFRERSETPELSTEISLQPWRNYKTDGVILFSDILTPLPVRVAFVSGSLFIQLLFCGQGLKLPHVCIAKFLYRVYLVRAGKGGGGGGGGIHTIWTSGRAS